MVKNSGINQPTDMVRLGRYTDCEQPKNSIVFNASDDKIRDIKHSGLYISPYVMQTRRTYLRMIRSRKKL